MCSTTQYVISGGSSSWPDKIKIVFSAIAYADNHSGFSADLFFVLFFFLRDTRRGCYEDDDDDDRVDDDDDDDDDERGNKTWKRGLLLRSPLNVREFHGLC